MKKVLIIICVIILIAAALLLVPVTSKQESKKAAKIKADNSAFVAKVLEEFENNPSIKASDAAQKVCDELNKISVNQYNKKEQAYTFSTNCKGCSSVEYDNKMTMVTLTTYNKKGELVSRVVIKPPSFVIYEKDKEK